MSQRWLRWPGTGYRPNVWTGASSPGPSIIVRLGPDHHRAVARFLTVLAVITGIFLMAAGSNLVLLLTRADRAGPRAGGAAGAGGVAPYLVRPLAAKLLVLVGSGRLAALVALRWVGSVLSALPQLAPLRAASGWGARAALWTLAVAGATWAVCLGLLVTTSIRLAVLGGAPGPRTRGRRRCPAPHRVLEAEGPVFYQRFLDGLRGGGLPPPRRSLGTPPSSVSALNVSVEIPGNSLLVPASARRTAGPGRPCGPPPWPSSGPSRVEYETSLPEVLADSRTAELLEGVCDIDLDALDVDLPRGFDRDWKTGPASLWAIRQGHGAVVESGANGLHRFGDEHVPGRVELEKTDERRVWRRRPSRGECSPRPPVRSL